MKKKLWAGLAIGLVTMFTGKNVNAEQVTLNSNIQSQFVAANISLGGTFNLTQYMSSLGKQNLAYNVESGTGTFLFHDDGDLALDHDTTGAYYFWSRSGDNKWYHRTHVDYYVDPSETVSISMTGTPAKTFSTTSVFSGGYFVGNAHDSTSQYCVSSVFGECVDHGYKNYSTDYYRNDQIATGSFGGTIGSLATNSVNQLNTNGTLNFSITANSSDYYFDSGSLSLLINYAPTNLLINSPSSITEGDYIVTNMSATDQDPDTLSFYINGIDAVSVAGSANSTRNSNHVYLGTYFDNDGAARTANIIGTVNDGSGGNSSITKAIDIVNVAPDATMHLSKTAINEGEFISAYMTATDPGNDYLDFTIAGQNAGTGVGGNVAGSTRTSDIVDLGQFFQTGSTPTQVTVEGSVIDDGTVPDFASAIFSVLNVAPIIDDVTYFLTDRNHLAFGATAHDPGMDTLSFSWDMDGDGSYDDFFGLGGTWEYLTAGLFSVGLQVADGDGGLGYRSFDITIDPAPVPEPATMLLMGTGLAGLVGSRCKRRNKA